MKPINQAGPDPDEITNWITATYPDTVIARSMGATFFSLNDKHWPNFATIVTTDEHDMGKPSKLDRPGVFRLNIGLGKVSFHRLVGAMANPTMPRSTGCSPTPSTQSSTGSRSSTPGARPSTGS